MEDNGVTSKLKIVALEKDMSYIAADISEIKELVKKLPSDIAESYVTKTEFFPVKSLTYGATTVILLGFITAIVALVMGVVK
jgi:hypothetical protein